MKILNLVCQRIKRLLKYIFFYIIKVRISNLLFELKKNTYKKNIYIKIKDFQNIHKNKRCFIIATGPSLKIEDIEILKSEITISMNSIVKLFSKTDWRPTYYMIQDKEVYEKIKKDIFLYKLKNIFYADIIKNFSKEKAIPFRLDLQKHLLGEDDTKFSFDFYKRVYDGYTITYSAIQLAIYMGFKEIYLLGCDTNYMGKSTHFIKYTEKLSKGIDKFYDHAIHSYSIAKKFADQKNIKIFNATKGGMLEVFPRINLRDIL